MDLTEQEGQFASITRFAPMLIEETLRFPFAPLHPLFEPGKRSAQARPLACIVRRPVRTGSSR
jgi:hypothetical protein